MKSQKECRWFGFQAAVAICICACGCAGGAPLMHPAHTLSEGKTRFAAGASANFALGNQSDAIDAAGAEPIGVVRDKPTEVYARGALAAAAVSPGVSPLVSGRLGLAYDTEAGFTYSGKAARIDGRRAWNSDSLSLSVGAGASALLSRRLESTDSQISGLDLGGATGFGFDVPVVFGWRSPADLVWLWAGVRGGYDRLRGTVGFVGASEADSVEGDISGMRACLTGILGVAVGFRYVHAAVELQGGGSWASGELWGIDVRVQGFTLSPAFALMVGF